MERRGPSRDSPPEGAGMECRRKGLTMENEKKLPTLSKQALRRLPEYLSLLSELQAQGVQSVSSPVLARQLHYGEVQVRKDLAAVSSEGGRPKTGFEVEGLIHDLTSFLGFDNADSAVLVGAGQLGSALLSYDGFAACGVKILAAFDANEALAGTRIHGKQVFPVSRLEELCRRLGAHIGIITTPASAAQEVCNRLVHAGVLAVWNFAPVTLTVPEAILVQNENMAASLAVLSSHLRQQLLQEGGSGKGGGVQ